MWLIWVVGIELVRDMSDAARWKNKSLDEDTYGESEMGTSVEGNKYEGEDIDSVDIGMEEMLWGDYGVDKIEGSEFVNERIEIDGERWECEPDCGNLKKLGKLSYKDEEAVVRTFVA